MTTIYEVSKLAGVSLATVSRVINKSSHVSDKTREKVLAAMKELGYRPNAIAQSLASKRTNSVGVLVPEIYGPFFGNMLSGIEEELREASKHVIFTVGHSDEEKEKAGIESLTSRNCDALILHVDSVSDAYLVELNSRVPVVLLDRLIPEIAANCIVLDNEHGGYIAAKSLLDAGHKQIAYISGPLWKEDARERLAGHKRALAEFGLRHDERLIFEGNYHESGGIEGLKYLIRTGIDFSAVVCANDETAAGVIRHTAEIGLKVPEELSVVGFDNVVFTRYLQPNLSTVDYPVNDMGHMAARWVLKHVYDTGDLEIRNLFEPEFVPRASVSASA